MLRNVKDLRGYAIRATDGLIGDVDDVYFDDVDWAIRYFVVDTGGWLPGRHVLISPVAIGHADWLRRELPVSLTKAQVAGSPAIDTKRPVSRQREVEYSRYYGYPYYWGGAGLWGMGAYPGGMTTEVLVDQDMKTHQTSAASRGEDEHLRSGHAILGYHIHATDGDIGHVRDLLVDDRTWAIRYLILDTSNWWLGHEVLVAPPWIESVSWAQAKVSVDLTRQAIRDAPPYDPTSALDRQREQAIYDHHGRLGYWMEQPVRSPASVEHRK